MNASVYILANDTVVEWLTALLKSLARHLPGAAVTVIPFNSDIGRLDGLRNEFRFSVLDHDSFVWLEEIGRRLEIGRTPQGPNWFRRFAVFFDERSPFLYLDARTLVLSDLAGGFELVGNGVVDFIHFGGDANQAFETGEVRSGFAARGRCFGFNSGLWISKAGLFSKHEMLDAADFCVAHRDQMNPRNTDQFFLNTLCARSSARVANYADFDGSFERDPWAFSHPKVYVRGGDTRVWAHGAASHGRRLPLVHWAGIGLSPAMPLRRLWVAHRYDGRVPLRIRLEMLTSLPGRTVNLARRSLAVRRFVSPANAGLR